MHIKANRTLERKFNSISSFPILLLGSLELRALLHCFPVYITIPVTVPVATKVLAHSVFDREIDSL